MRGWRGRGQSQQACSAVAVCWQQVRVAAGGERAMVLVNSVLRNAGVYITHRHASSRSCCLCCQSFAERWSASCLVTSYALCALANAPVDWPNRVKLSCALLHPALGQQCFERHRRSCYPLASPLHSVRRTASVASHWMLGVCTMQCHRHDGAHGLPHGAGVRGSQAPVGAD